jgi:hypothetical protein
MIRCPREPDPTLEEAKQWVAHNYGTDRAADPTDPGKTPLFYSALTNVQNKCTLQMFGTANGQTTYMCVQHRIMATDQHNEGFKLRVGLAIGLPPYCVHCGDTYSKMDELIDHFNNSYYGCLAMLQDIPPNERIPQLRNFTPQLATEQYDDEEEVWEEDEPDFDHEFATNELTPEDLLEQERTNTLNEALDTALANATFATVVELDPPIAQGGHTITMPNGTQLTWDETTQQYLVNPGA